LQARYFPENSDSAVIVPLGTITRPPYKLIWNTYNIPNQLFTGIGILAEAILPNGTTQIALQEGIFLTHNPIKRKSIPIPYAVNIQKSGASVTQAFDLKDGQKSGHGFIVLNDSGLVVSVKVNDPSFYINRRGHDIADAGLEILLDPARKRSPYPTGGVLFYVVPLSGSPYKIDYRVNINNGTFKLVPQATRINYEYSVALREFRGYDVQFTIPKEAFGKSIPDTLGCNIILRVLDTAGQVKKIPLNGSNIHEMYSPVTWSEYHMPSKSIDSMIVNSALEAWTMYGRTGYGVGIIFRANGSFDNVEGVDNRPWNVVGTGKWYTIGDNIKATYKGSTITVPYDVDQESLILDGDDVWGFGWKSGTHYSREKGIKTKN
jgi:hypothetical protein